MTVMHITILYRNRGIDNSVKMISAQLSKTYMKAIICPRYVTEGIDAAPCSIENAGVDQGILHLIQYD